MSISEPGVCLPARWLLLVLLPVAAQLPAFAADRALTLASWNIEHLAATDGQGCRARDAADYRAIRRYLEQLDADVIAFQEVESRRAARRIFPAEEYHVHISERPSRQLSQCYDGPNHRLMQRTGFAVRRDLDQRLGLEAVRQPDFRELQGGYQAGRWAVHLILEQAGAPGPDSGESAANAPRFPLHLLSVHLKSGCAYQSIRAKQRGKKTNNNCLALYRQAEVLAGWIRMRAGAGQDFIIAGDFNRQLDQLSDEVWQRLEAGGSYVDLEKALPGLKHPRPYKRRYPFAVDHMVYNQALDALMVEEKTYFDVRAERYSDHLPLVSVFEFLRRETILDP